MRAVRKAALILLTALSPGWAQTVLDRVYTNGQADRGDMEFHANCAKCQEGADVDGPPLAGDPFIDRWREDNLSSLFNFIKTKMPQDSPGKLSDGAYRDVVAYLLKSNDYPAGDRELTADALDATLLVGKDGPKPLPTNSVVRVVGCVSQSGNTILLAKATNPARTRTGDSTTPEELKASGGRPLGSQSFQLRNLDDVKPGFKLESVAGQKIQVKGVLVRQSGGDRINVLSLEIAGPGCSP